VEDIGFVASVEEDWVSLQELDLGSTREVIERLDEVERAVRYATDSLGTDPIFGCPAVLPGKIIGIGLNYMDHVRETGAEVPAEPVVFAKFSSALIGPNDPIEIDPSASEAVDYEAELAVVIGRRVRNASPQTSLDSIFGYCVANDVSARDWQGRDPRITRSKSLDTFCPVGPWLTTAGDIADVQRLAIESRVNGEIRQHSSTEQMIFTVADLVAYLSRGTTLEPGDMILTGTPPGVGFAMDPPRYLRPGDVVECEITGMGSLRNGVRAFEPDQVDD
jgi:2-keto-4-pentenoate hydratase/2-oxohepta-3-ene-1,7-dioic acid hydratase in catechol pathway